MNLEKWNDELKRPGAIRLELNQPVPAFKNRKRIVGKQLRTDRKVKKRMNQIVDDFVYQLLSAFQQSAGGTLTAVQVQSLTHCWLPADDCWTCIPELIVTADLAETDGATIWIERLP